MTKRRRRKPEQIVTLLQEGEAMLSAGKSLGKVLQKLEVTRLRRYGGKLVPRASRVSMPIAGWMFEWILLPGFPWETR